MAAPGELIDGVGSNGARDEQEGGGVASSEFGRVVESIDRRLTNVEQILPTLATKEDVDSAIARAIEPLATKAEMAALKEELRSEIRDEGARTRRHFDVVAERLQENIKAIAEGHAALSDRLVDMKATHDADIARLDVRVTRLEASR
ncbi:MAG: hypothetical protein AB7I50_17810 [Vicinamibacterales bacterium]